jgi:hypothetical protein
MEIGSFLQDAPQSLSNQVVVIGQDNTVGIHLKSLFFWGRPRTFAYLGPFPPLFLCAQEWTHRAAGQKQGYILALLKGGRDKMGGIMYFLPEIHVYSFLHLTPKETFAP